MPIQFIDQLFIRWIRSATLTITAVLGVAHISGCDSQTDPSRQKQQQVERSVDATRVMGFESFADWNAGSGTVSSSTFRVEGNFSLQVNSTGWTEVTSMPVADIGDIGGEASVELYLPQPEPWGGVRLVIVSGDTGIWWGELSCAEFEGCPGNEYGLAALTSGEWHRLRFDLTDIPVEIAGADDLQFKVVINGAQGTRFLDDLRTTDGVSGGTGGTAGGTGGTSGTGGAQVNGNTAVLGFEAIDFGTPRGAFHGATIESNCDFEESVLLSLDGDGMVDGVRERTEGAASLGVALTCEGTAPSVTYQFKTPKLSRLGEIGANMTFDLRLPQIGTVDSLGHLEVMVNGAGLNWQWVGQTQLNGTLMNMGDFRTVQIPIPPAIRQALEGTYDDLQFQFTLRNAKPGIYVFDDLTFESSIPEQVPPAPSSFVDRVLSFENLDGWSVTGASVTLGDVFDDAPVGSEGASLCLSEFTEARIESVNLGTLGEINEDGTLELSLLVPESVPSVQVDAYLSIPSQQIWSDYQGYVTVTPAGGGFRTVVFDFSEHKDTIETAIYGDLSLEFLLRMATPSADPVCLDGADLGQQRFGIDYSGETQVRHFDIDLPFGATLAKTAVYSGRLATYFTGDVFLNDFAGGAGASADVVSWGPLTLFDHTAFGAGVDVRDVYSMNGVTLSGLAGNASNVRVNGTLFAAGPVIDQGANVGEKIANAWLYPIQKLRWRLESPVIQAGAPSLGVAADEATGDLTLQAAPSESAVYRTVQVNSGQTLHVYPGVYHLEKLTLAGLSNVQLHNSAPIVIIARQPMSISGSAAADDPSINNVWWVVLPDEDFAPGELPRGPRDDEGNQLPYITHSIIDFPNIVTSRTFFGTLLADRISLLNTTHRGSVYAREAALTAFSTVRLLVPTSLGCDCAQGMTLGCGSAGLLDGDGDGLVNCAETVASTWSEPGVFNGLTGHSVAASAAYPTELGLCAFASGSDEERLAAFDEIVVAVTNSSATLKAEQGSGWFHGTDTACGTEYYGFPGYGLPGDGEGTAGSCASPGRNVAYYQGYWEVGVSGQHCFRMTSASESCSAIRVGQGSAARYLDSSDEATQCMNLSAGIYPIEFLFGSAGARASDVSYRFCGAMPCVVEPGTGSIPAWQLRTTQSYNPTTTQISCSATSSACTELCPCDGDDALCSDGNLCTADVCNYPEPGTNYFPPISPDDGNHCTEDTCDPTQGVINAAIDTGKMCTFWDCDPSDPDSGEEVFFTSAPISDGNACTSEFCDEEGNVQSVPTTGVTGPCVQTVPGSSCDPETGVLATYENKPEGTACGQGRTCRSGLCLLQGQDPADIAFPPGQIAVTVSDLAEEIDVLGDGCTPSTVPPENVAIVSGVVGHAVGEEEWSGLLAGARVSIAGACEYVESDAEGKFRLPVPGGGKQVIRFEKDGYLSVDRIASTSRGTGAVLDLVVLVEEGEGMDFQLIPGGGQILQGPSFTALTEGGEIVEIAQASVYLPPETSFGPADATSGTLTLTPYTTGAAGPERMPADVPPGTAYTHAFEINAYDDNGAPVQPNAPVIYYVDNFMAEEDCEPSAPPEELTAARLLAGSATAGTGDCTDYEVGKPVPTFYYNDATAKWERDPVTDDGVIIEILCTDGIPTSVDTGVEGWSLPEEEVEALLATRNCGQLWRVELSHFSPYDLNFYRRLGLLDSWLAAFNQFGGARGDETCKAGSYIGVETGKLRESVALPGIDQQLVYNSDAMFGYKRDRTFGHVVAPLGGFESWEVAGIERYSDLSYLPFVFDPPRPNWSPITGSSPRTWSGLDAEGRRLYGSFAANDQLNVVVPNPVQGGLTLAFTTFLVSRPTTVHVHDAITRGLGGWTLSGHHALHQDGGTLYRGDQGRVSENRSLDLVYSNSQLGGAAQAPHQADFAVTRNGSAYLYTRDSPRNHLSFKSSSSGSSYPQLVLSDIGENSTLSIDPTTDRLLVTSQDHQKLFEVLPPSEWTSTAPESRTLLDFSGTGRAPLGVVVRDDGSVVVAMSNPGPGFRIEAYELLEFEDRPARLATQPLFGWAASVNQFPRELLMKPWPGVSGGLVVAAVFSGQPLQSRIFSYTPERGIEPIIWGECLSGESCHPDITSFGEGMAAGEVRLPGIYVRGLLPLENGQILFSLSSNLVEAKHRIYALTPQVDDPGERSYVVSRWAGPRGGVGCTDSSFPTEGPAKGVCFTSRGAGLALGPDGHVWTLGGGPVYGGARPVMGRFLTAPTEGSSVHVPSQDGQELFVFGTDGRHQLTLDPRDPSVVLREFIYEDDEPGGDGSKRLVGFIERGQESRVERSGDTVEISSPFGHVTRIHLDPVTGYARTIERRPIGGGDTIAVSHDSEGMLRAMVDGDGTHTYEYSELGELVGDHLQPNEESSPSTSQSLSSAESRGFGRYEHTNGAGEVSRYSARPNPDEFVRTASAADGTGYELVTDGADETIQSFTDGSVVTTQWGTDKTSGIQVATSQTLALPDGPSVVQTSSSSVQGAATAAERISTETTTVMDGSMPLSTTVVTDAGTNTRTVTSPLGRTIATTYDDKGRTTSVQVGGLEPQTVNYYADTDPALGQPESIAQGGTALATFDYYPTGVANGAGYLSSVTIPGDESAEETVTTFVRDGYGRPTKSSIGTHDTLMSYDWDGRLTSVTEPDNVALSAGAHVMSYQASGELASYQPVGADDPDQITQWIYDGARRVAEIDFPVDASETQSIYFSRDSLAEDHPGRLRRVDLVDNDFSESIDYVYGDEAFHPHDSSSEEEPVPLGRPGQVRSVRRGELETQYTWNGPLQAKEELVTVPLGMRTAALEWVPDNLLRVGEKRLSVSGSAEENLGFQYNHDSQLKTILVNGSAGIRFRYDGEEGDLDENLRHGLLEGAVTPGATVAEDISESTTYDNFGRLKTYTVERDTIPLYSLDVEIRDALGRIKRQTVTYNEQEPETRTFTYDDRGQLETATVNGVITVYEYDGNGNRLCARGVMETCSEWAYGANNELEEAGGYDYTYDAAGRLETRTTTMGASTSYDYDLLGSLREVAITNGSSVVTDRILYTNDHSGRRVRRQRLDQSGTLTDEAQYIWANDLQIEAELDEEGEVLSRFVYGLKPNVPELIIRQEDTYRVITDHLGSPVLVVGIETENVLLEASYDAWGNPYDVSINGTFRGTDTSLWPIPHGFAGGLYDAATGLVRFGARDYDPAVGRWTAKDPILFAGGQANLYVYVGNNPIGFVDQNGLKTGQLGPEAELCVIACGSINPNIAWDDSGNVAFNLSVSGGWSTNIGYSLGGTYEWTDASSVAQLSGFEWYAGAGAKLGGLFGTLEYVRAMDGSYDGGAVSLGQGFSAFPAELRAGVTAGANAFLFNFKRWFDAFSSSDDCE